MSIVIFIISIVRTDESLYLISMILDQNSIENQNEQTWKLVDIKDLIMFHYQIDASQI